VRSSVSYFILFLLLSVFALSCKKANSLSTHDQLLGIWDNQNNMNNSISFNKDGTGNVNTPPGFSALFTWSLVGDTLININYVGYPPDKWRITALSGSSLVANELDSSIQEFYSRP